MKTRSNERGFALPVAIFALVVLGVLVTGGFFVARQETRIGVATKNSSQAFYMTERAIGDALETYSLTDLNGMAEWADSTVTDTLDEGVAEITFTRTGDLTFFVEGEGTITEGGALRSGANRKLGMLVRAMLPNIDPPGALTTIGNLNFGGNAVIDGNDTDPPEWPAGMCDPADHNNKPGIYIDDESNIDYNGNETNIKQNQLFGDPDVVEDNTLDSDSILTFGDMTFEDLVEMATLNLTSDPGDPAPTVTAGICDTSLNNNWGEPLLTGHACFNYLPIIHLDNEGATWNFSTGRGQGILLVSGSIKVTGNFEFYGPVIVKGTLSTQGGGGTQHFHGGVMAANVDLEDNSVLGTADIVYSSCSLKRAIQGNSNLTRLRPIAERNWVDMTNIGN